MEVADAAHRLFAAVVAVIANVANAARTWLGTVTMETMLLATRRRPRFYFPRRNSPPGISRRRRRWGADAYRRASTFDQRASTFDPG